MTVEAPAGNVIGYVSQAWSICKPRYKIQTANEDTVLRVKGPCCTWNLCGDIEFDVRLKLSTPLFNVLGALIWPYLRLNMGTIPLPK